MWAARPTRRFFLRGNDLVVIPLAVVGAIACARWLLVALGWFGRGIAPVDAIFAAVGILVAAGQLMKRIVVPWQLRGRRWYAITDRRCVWVSDGRPHELRVVVPPHVLGVMRERHGDGTATISIALRYSLDARFERVADDDAAEAERLIAALLRAPQPRQNGYVTDDAKRGRDDAGGRGGDGGDSDGRGAEV